MARLGREPNEVKAYADTRDALGEALTGADNIRDRVAGENESGPAAGKSGAADAQGD